MDVPAGVLVDPPDQTLGTQAVDVVEFTVTVAPGSAGQIVVQLQSLDGRVSARPFGPLIVASTDGWRFTAPDMS